MDKPNCFIYILQLENNKFYVGKTQYPDFRLEQHFNNQGSQWIIKYKPIQLIKLIQGDNFDEDKYTRIFMAQYGIDNVRGGSYCQFELSEETKNHLQREIEGAKDLCFNCHQPGHFIKDCKMGKDVIMKSGVVMRDCEMSNGGMNGDVVMKDYGINKSDIIMKNDGMNGDVVMKDSGMNKGVKVKNVMKEKSDKKCKRCGYYGHKKSDCHAKTHSDGTPFQIKKCSKCKRSGHNAKKCYAKTDIDGNKI